MSCCTTLAYSGDSPFELVVSRGSALEGLLVRRQGAPSERPVAQNRRASKVERGGLGVQRWQAGACGSRVRCGWGAGGNGGGVAVQMRNICQVGRLRVTLDAVRAKGEVIHDVNDVLNGLGWKEMSLKA